MRFVGSKGIKFSDISINCCICFIDLVDSTKNTLAFCNSKDTRRYYETFINSVSEIAKKNKAKIIKNMGDSLLFYFPKTSDSTNISAFYEALECSFEILENRHNINDKLSRENFPPFNYRISMDYGVIEIALSGEYNQLDLFGSTVNLCAKINQLSLQNELRIGDNLYRILNAYSPFFEKLYNFTKSEQYNISSDIKYFTYTIERRPSKSEYLKDQDISDSNKEQESQQMIYRNYDLRKKVILVDDDPEVLTTIELFLTGHDFYVTSFIDPTMTVEYLRSNPFYQNLLVIADIRMSKLNGFQLYQQIKSIDPTIKVLFITGLYIADEILTLIPGLDKDLIITKPIDKETFVNRVKKLFL
jgi:CheY-like chemotaxis protein